MEKDKNCSNDVPKIDRSEVDWWKLGVKEPPLGIKPEFIFKEERIYDLADGIDRFIKAGLLKKDCNLIYEWCTELHHRLLTYREEICERDKD